LTRLSEQNSALRERLRSAEHSTARTLMRATRLAQVIAVLGNVADLETTTDRAAVELAELFSCDIALLLLESPDGLKIEGHWGVKASDLPSDGSDLRALEEIAAQRSVGTAPAADVALPSWLADYEPHRLAWARLLVGDKSLGLLLLIRRADEPFEADEENELRAIAYRLALAFENGLLHRHMRSQLAQLRRLQQLTADLAGMIEPDAVGQRIADTLVAEAGVTASMVTIERDGQSTVLAHASEPGHTEALSTLALAAAIGLDDRWQTFPLTVADRTVGVVAVEGGPSVGSEAHELLLHVVGLAGLALDKALLYERTIEQARHDALTGLLGHRVFYEMLDQQLESGRPFSVALFDIDDFKEINDLHGHHAGDEVLRLVAQGLRRNVRSEDSIFRVGGEEFYALLPDLTPTDALAIAERLRVGIAQLGSTLPYPVTFSAGVASLPSYATSRDELLAGADAALYISKRAGKNRTSVAGEDEPSEATSVDRTIRLELLLHKDAETVTHSIHTANLAVQLARVLAMPDNRIADLRTAAKLHDIGKVGVPTAILNKPGPLDEEEFRIVKTHPVVGAELLTAWGMQTPAQIVLRHHERVDGRGYPSGLRGDEITLESRILHVADAFIAMTLDRPYRRALSQAAAIEELIRHRGTQFDEQVVDALLAISPAAADITASSTASLSSRT
jgi:diguanylate cyclase (GGDEF)-like protein/putative nucleotidyltransferase with HDIG domain